MKTLYIGFSKPYRHPFPLLSWIIRLLENKPFSHVYARWYDDENHEYLVFDVRPPQSKIIKAVDFYTFSDIIYEFELEVSDDEFKLLIEEYQNYSGISYGWIELFGIGVMQILKLLSIKSKNHITDRDTIFCTEANYEILNKIIGLDLNKCPTDVTLSDLYDYLDNHY